MGTIKFCLPVLLLYANCSKIIFDSSQELSDQRSLLTYSTCQGSCKADNFYDSLVNRRINNVILWKISEGAPGNKALIIWKEGNCIYGEKFFEDVARDCSIEPVEASNQALGLLALKLFYISEKDTTLVSSKVVSLHDFRVNIRALVKGSAIFGDFYFMNKKNVPFFLVEISELCSQIMFGYKEIEQKEKKRKRK